MEQIFFYDIVECEKVLGEDSRRSLQQLLEKPQDNLDQYLLSFRFAIRQKNNIARYSLLYNVLLSIFGDNQKSIDQFIEIEEPDVIKTPRPDKPSVLETIYTRLRNEISHRRPNIDLRKTELEINNIVNKFQNLVKKAIK